MRKTFKILSESVPKKQSVKFLKFEALLKIVNLEIFSKTDNVCLHYT